MATPLEAASAYLGYDERNKKDAQALSSFFQKQAGLDLDPAQTAWCAAFLNSVLGETGYGGTGKLNARSFLDYGTPVDTPEPGDIVVFQTPGSSWQGHVGLVQSVNPDGTLQVLGGNQKADGSGARGVIVNVRTRGTGDVLGYRRPVPIDSATATSALTAAGIQPPAPDSSALDAIKAATANVPGKGTVNAPIPAARPSDLDALRAGYQPSLPPPPMPRPAMPLNGLGQAANATANGLTLSSPSSPAPWIAQGRAPSPLSAALSNGGVAAPSIDLGGPSYIGREIPIPGASPSAPGGAGLAGTVQMPAGVRPASVSIPTLPTLAPWLAGGQAVAQQQLASQNTALPRASQFDFTNAVTLPYQPPKTNEVNGLLPNGWQMYADRGDNSSATAPAQVGNQTNYGSDAPIYEPQVPNYVGKPVPVAAAGVPKTITKTIQVPNPQYMPLGATGGAPDLASVTPYLDANGNVVNPLAAPTQPKTIPKQVTVPNPAYQAPPAVPPLQYEITGGYVWAKSNDGRWVSLGRAPNNPPANPVNMIGQGIAGIGNQMGINLGTMNGLDMAHFLDQQGLAPVAPQRRYNADTNQWEYVNGAPKSAPTGVAGSPKAPMSPFGNLGGGLLGMLMSGLRAPAAGQTATGLIPGIGAVPKPSPTALTQAAAINHAANGTYADNIAANNAANFNRNAGTYNPDVVKQTGGNFSSFSPEWGYS